MHFGPRLLAFARLSAGCPQDPPFDRWVCSTLCRAMQRLARRTWWRRCGPAPSSTPMRRAREVVGSGCGSSRTSRSTRSFRAVVSRPPRCWGKTTRAPRGRRLGPLPLLQGSDATDYNHLLHRCHELLETATRGAVPSHAWSRPSSGTPSPFGAMLARSARMACALPRDSSRRSMNRARIHQSCQPAIRETSATQIPHVSRTRFASPWSLPQDLRRRQPYRERGQAQILMSVLQSCRHKGIRVIEIVTSILRAPDNTPVPLVNPER